MAVSMISMNSISFSNSDSGSPAGSGSRLLDFGTGNTEASASAPPMDTSAMPMDQSSMAPQMDASMMMQSAPPMMDSYQPMDNSAAFTPPPQAAPSPSGNFDFVA